MRQLSPGRAIRHGDLPQWVDARPRGLAVPCNGDVWGTVGTSRDGLGMLRGCRCSMSQGLGQWVLT